MNKVSRIFDELKLAIGHVENLLDHRQSITSFYLSVNLQLAGNIDLLLKDTWLK
jgi:hypothetical protein